MDAIVKEDLRGRVALVTGANTGIGLVTARELARAGAHVVLACRSPEKAAAAMAAIRRQVPRADLASLALDLADLASVRAAAATYAASGKPLHILIDNAGLYGVKGLTRDGFEMHFGTNHLGPYLFTRLLVPTLLASAPARVVIVASMAHRAVRRLDFAHLTQPTRTRTGIYEYAVSKLGNILFAKALALRLDPTRITTHSLHPGGVATDLWRTVPSTLRWLILRGTISTEEGAKTSLYCATSPAVAGDSGLYYDRCRAKKPSALALDPGLADELWQRSADWTGLPR